MFGSPKRGVGAYATVGLETGVAAASPQKLVVMLYDGVIVALLSAINHIKSSNIAAKGASISKAITIIDNGLRASLDKKAGGEIAENLDALYDYMSRRLLQANIKNDISIIQEIHGLMSNLREAWVAIGEKSTSGEQAPAIQQAPTMMSA
jgi:flagellar protein FliS